MARTLEVALVSAHHILRDSTNYMLQNVNALFDGNYSIAPTHDVLSEMNMLVETQSGGYAGVIG